MAGTLMLNDQADKTAFPVFDREALSRFEGLVSFYGASNVQLLPVLDSFKTLPWDTSTGVILCEAHQLNGHLSGFDTRGQLRAALQQLETRGWSLRCGLEVEFHLYRLLPSRALPSQDRQAREALDPELAAWPGPVPRVEMTHPGYRLLNDEAMTACEVPMGIIEKSCKALGLPLHSLEIEFGPSQVEVVFDATDALQAADHMVLLRNLVRQALAREGYYASFVCRPPFPNVMSSGWHVHQSLVDGAGRNLFMRERTGSERANSGVLEAGVLVAGASESSFSEASLSNTGFSKAGAEQVLSDLGTAYLAGLLQHTQAMAAFCVPTLNGYERFRPNALAPQKANWGFDDRSALCRVVGLRGDAATRIENRLGEPMANPYLCLASQIYAGLKGIDAALEPSCEADAQPLPTSLSQAVEALEKDTEFAQQFGPGFASYFAQIKRFEIARLAEAPDPVEFLKREYFGRF